MSLPTPAPVVMKPARANTAGRTLVLVATLGTLMPLALLALMYVLAPLPMTESAAATLKMANRFAGLLVVVNWAFVVAMALMSRLAPKLDADWQPITLVQRGSR